MKTMILTGLASALLLAVAAVPVCAADAVQSEQADWQKLDAMKPEAVAEFLKAYPAGAHAREANVLALVHQRLAAYRDKKEQPRLVIPAALLGMNDRPKVFRTDNGLEFTVHDPKPGEPANPPAHRPEHDLLGIQFTRIPMAPDVAILSFHPLGKGDGELQSGADGPILPGVDGAVVALKTYGLNTKDVFDKLKARNTLFGGYNFVAPYATSMTSLDGTVFFGVIEGVGLVHLYGDLRVIAPDGRETELHEPPAKTP